MPRAFLVKKTRGVILEKSGRADDSDYLEYVNWKKTKQTDFWDSYNDRQDQDIILDQKANQQMQHYPASTESKALTNLQSNCKLYSSPNDSHIQSGCPAQGNVGGFAEPMDLSTMKPTMPPILHISSTSAFDHVERSAHVSSTDDAQITESNQPPSLGDAFRSGDSLPLSTAFAYSEPRDEPLNLQVRRTSDKMAGRDSPQSSETAAPVESRPLIPYDTCLIDRDEEDGTEPVLTQRTQMSSFGEIASFKEDVFFRYPASERNDGAADRYNVTYCQLERVGALTTSTPDKHYRYDMSTSYVPNDKYNFPTDVNSVSHTDIRQKHTVPQQLFAQNSSPNKDNYAKLSPQPSMTNNIFVKNLNLLRRSHYTLGRTLKRAARQPILGLEYVQNTPNFQDSQSPNQDTSKLQQPDVKGKNDSNLESVFSMKLTGRQTDVGNMGTEDTASRPVEKVKSATVAKPIHHKKYVCDVCGKGFSRSNTLVTHKRIHTGDKPFKCELCGRAFRQPGNLTRHRLTHTTVKPYVCQQCGKAFNRASNLHTHMRTHTNYKPFVCQYCGKGFHQKIDMKIHSYTHTGEKPHKCKKCGRGFKQLTHLTYHMRTHSDIKMYTCTYCGKGFNQKGNLQAHIYGHTGERPYHCEICNKGFTLASTLNTHRRTHAEKKPYACQYCGKDFYQKNALKSHMIASHPYTGKSLL